MNFTFNFYKKIYLFLNPIENFIFIQDIQAKLMHKRVDINYNLLPISI